MPKPRFLLLLFILAFLVRPVSAQNDSCLNALPISCGQVLSGSTNLATLEGSLQNCNSVSVSAAGVWYSFSGIDAEIVLSTCQGATFDTQISVYTGSCGSLVCETANDDEFTCSGGASQVNFLANSTVTYYVLVHGKSNQVGDFSLSLQCFGLGADVCDQAQNLTCGDTVNGSTSQATLDSSPGCGTVSVTAPGIWYTFSGNNTQVTLSTCNATDYDSKITVYEAPSGCTSLSCYAANDDGPGCAGFSSSVSFFANAGDTYYILIHGYQQTVGNFSLSVSCSAPCLPVPVNDVCLNAEPLMIQPSGNCILTSGTNACATPSLSNPSCDLFGTIQDIWYTFNSGAESNLYLHFSALSGSQFSVALYDSCTGNLLSCFSPSGLDALPPLDVSTDYWLQVWNNGGSSEGSFELCIESPPPPPTNDSCFSASWISCGDTLSGSTSFATQDLAPNCGSVNVEESGVWYKILGNGQEITVSTCGIASFDTKLSVYSGSCDSLTCIAANDDGVNCSDFSSQLSFNSVPGMPYTILVHGYSGATGTFDLAVSCGPICLPVPENDHCPNAVELVVGTHGTCNIDTFTNICVSNNLNNPFCDPFLPIKDVWFTFQSGMNSQVLLDFFPYSASNLNYALYDSCGGFPLICSPFVSQGWLTGLDTGSTYWLQIWNNGNGEDGEFGICIQDPPLPPSNDICFQADTVLCGEVVSGSTLPATIDSVPVCPGVQNTAPGVWYLFEGTGQTVTASLCDGTDFDTQISVFSGECQSLVCETANDDSPNCTNPVQSEVSFLTTLGETYWILVHAYSTNAGNFQLSIDCDTLCSPVPPNDQCDSATLLMIEEVAITGTCSGLSFSGSCAGNSSFFPSCNTGGEMTDVWFQFNSEDYQLIQLSLFSDSISGFHYTLYDGCAGNELMCGTAGLDIILSGLLPLSDYFLQIWTPLESMDDFELCISGRNDINDACVRAEPLSCGMPVTGTTANAASEGMYCNGVNFTSPALWYQFTGSGELVTLSTCGSASFDTRISVFTGSCANILCFLANDDAPQCNNLNSELTFNASLGTEYFVVIHGHNQETGSFELSMNCGPECLPVPSNDVCSTAIPLNITLGECQTFDTFPLACATPANVNPTCNPFNSSYDVWFQFNPGNLTELMLHIADGENLMMALYEDCGSGAIPCLLNPGEDVALEDLSPNTDYFLQFWSNSFPFTGEFSLCLEGPACDTPINFQTQTTQLTPANPTTEFTWNSNSADATYQIEWGLCGFEPGTGTQLGIKTGNSQAFNSAIITLSDTMTQNYCFYIRETCSTGAISEWSDSLEITFLVGKTSSINPKVRVSLYPNPNSGAFTLDIKSPISEQVRVEVWNILGKNIFAEQIWVTTDNFSHNIRSQGIPVGVYMVKVNGSDWNRTEKMIVK